MIPDKALCPKCHSSEQVSRKIHALPWGLGYNGAKEIDAPGPQFVNGFWCAHCEIGFVPNELFDAFGLEQVRGI